MTKFHKIIVLFVLIFILILGFFWYIFYKSYIFNEILGVIFSPFWKSSTYAGKNMRSFFENYFFMVDLKRENERLKEENLLLKSLLAQYKEREKIYHELERFFHISYDISYPKIAARIIYRPIDYFSEVIFLDKGSKNGITPQMPVLAVAGGEGVALVGQVVEVYNNWCKVILITHPSFAADVRVLKSGDRGILRGRGERYPFVYYIPAEAKIEIGDDVITSGQDALFPSGLLIGKIKSIEKDPAQGIFKIAEIVPAVNFHNLDVVFILARIPEIPL